MSLGRSSYTDSVAGQQASQVQVAVDETENGTRVLHPDVLYFGEVALKMRAQRVG